MSLVRFSPDEQFLAVVSGGGTLVVWELHLTGSRLSKVGREGEGDSLHLTLVYLRGSMYSVY